MNIEFGNIYNIDCLKGLRMIPDNSVDCCVTSPPYYGLRDYGCDGQIGLEQSPTEYIDRLTEVFAEVYRVLKPEGTLWLNLGDTYNGNKTGNTNEKWESVNTCCFKKEKSDLCKTKDLIGIPWMAAFALRDRVGFYLRQDIIWAKPNVMPEPVTDRCTKSHEYIFLMSKSGKYYFDHEAAQEKGVVKEKRNKRDVWNVPTRPDPNAHFATYPEELIRPCILAGCPKGGVVLDPFMGSGTTARVAKHYGRNYVGFELNKGYFPIIQSKLQVAQDLFC